MLRSYSGSQHMEDEEPLLAKERQSRQETLSIHPITVTRVIKRCRALATDLVPIPIKDDEITSPTSGVLTQRAIQSFAALPGDFSPSLPFALLTARREFLDAASRNPSSADEMTSRALVCEAVARACVEKLDNQESWTILSARFATVDEDGEETLPLSALETAVDQSASHFLSSSTCQNCVFALWRGLLVQKNIGDDEGGIAGIQYQLHRDSKNKSGFLASFDPLRIGVPRYQFIVRTLLWVVFIAAYCVAIQTPQRGLGPEDYVIYTMAAGYIVEELVRMWKIGVLPALTYWTIINVTIYALMAVSLFYRLADMGTTDIEKSDHYRLMSFSWLSCASPLVWSRLVTIFDVHQFFGILQIVVFRMLKSSAIFFALLSILAVGFTFALSGLDINPDHDVVVGVMHHLMQALLGSPQFGEYEKGTPSYPFGIILYYTWSTLTLVILLNILIALFGSAYAECTEEAVPTFLAFFSTKTLSAIRAPDTFVFIAPFNLVEALIVPLEYVVPRRTYTRINRVAMSILFFLPLCCIALFESHFDPSLREDMHQLRAEEDPATSYSEEDLDPEAFVPPERKGDGERAEVDADGEGEEAEEVNRELGENGNGDASGKRKEERQISRTSYAELKKGLPNPRTEVTDLILEELRSLRRELAELKEQKEE